MLFLSFDTQGDTCHSIFQSGVFNIMGGFISLPMGYGLIAKLLYFAFASIISYICNFKYIYPLALPHCRNIARHIIQKLW